MLASIPASRIRTGGYLIAVAVGLIALRIGYDRLNAEQLQVLLWPSAWLIGLSLNAHPVAGPEGIAFPDLGVLLDRSCAGGHTFLLIIGVAAFALRHYRPTTNTPLRPVAIILGVVIGAYVLTVLGNASRVMMTLLAARIDPGTVGAAHTLIGTFIQLSLLLITYVALHPTRSGHRPA